MSRKIGANNAEKIKEYSLGEGWGEIQYLAINLIIAAYIYLSLRFVSLKEHEVNITQINLKY
jgi:hypothetical protein